jgi:hypothetical protein
MTFEACGGHTYFAVEEGLDGYDQTIVSFEAERGKLPFLIEVGRPLKKSELETLIQEVAKIYE